MVELVRRRLRTKTPLAVAQRVPSMETCNGHAIQKMWNVGGIKRDSITMTQGHEIYIQLPPPPPSSKLSWSLWSLSTTFSSSTLAAINQAKV